MILNKFVEIPFAQVGQGYCSLYLLPTTLSAYSTSRWTACGAAAHIPVRPRGLLYNPATPFLLNPGLISLDIISARPGWILKVAS